nr:unnamed protein product [Salmo salar]|eukprot:XP_014030179.1 PREDICTED: ras-associated and pleckstrin homology domains-containing protein 1-like [Salmo salar]
MESASRPYPLTLPPMHQSAPPSRTSYTSVSPETSHSPPDPPPLPHSPHQAAPTNYVKYSTIARLQGGPNQTANHYNVQPIGQQQGPPAPPLQSVKPNYNTMPLAPTLYNPPLPPPPPTCSMPAPGSAMASLRLGPPSPVPQFIPPPQAQTLPPPPPLEEDYQYPPLTNTGLQQFLAQKFPNMNYDFSDLDGQPESPPPPPPTFSPPVSPPAPPKTFSGVFPPQTAAKTFGPGIPMSPVSPSLPSGPMKKQQSFSTGHSPNQPPPTMPKQHSFSSKTLPVSAPISPTPSLVKQIVNQFPGAPLPPHSPPAVKAKPRWQPGGQIHPQSPEFPPPPPPEDSLDFPLPPHSVPTPVPPPLSPAKMGSPIKKSPSSTSTGSFGKRGPPPTPQRASSIKSNSSGEYQEEVQVQRQPKKVESLVSMFAQPGLGSCNSSAVSSSSGSPVKDSGPPAPPKPGKLNLSTLPLALQGLQTGQHRQPSGDFPSPPSELDYFPPPPPDSELLPPPLPSELHPGGGAPRVAVVNPQPQATPISHPVSQSSWKTQSLKKTPPPTLHRLSRSNTVQDPLPLSPPPFGCPLAPTLPGGSKGGGGTLSTVQPNFLEDLNRTLKRKSITRHGSLTRHGSSRLEPVSMDDMSLPLPPPPELLLDQQRRGGHGGSHGYMSSGYATLRRGPRPAPPKRDQSTKLTGEW